ncbi:MAG: hypothetical protein QXG58_07570 [Candidatus Bathyarchaeia archaeon]
MKMKDPKTRTETIKTFSLKLATIKQLIIDTQAIRRRLIESLQELYEIASKWAAEDSDAMRVAAYLAQTINSIARAYDERELDDILSEAKNLLERVKAKAEGEGV